MLLTSFNIDSRQQRANLFISFPSSACVSAGEVSVVSVSYSTTGDDAELINSKRSQLGNERKKWELEVFRLNQMEKLIIANKYGKRSNRIKFAL